MRHDFRGDGSTPNAVFSAMTHGATNNGRKRPIFAYGREDPNRPLKGRLADLNTTDVNMICDHLLNYEMLCRGDQFFHQKFSRWNKTPWPRSIKE